MTTSQDINYREKVFMICLDWINNKVKIDFSLLKDYLIRAGLEVSSGGRGWVETMTLVNNDRII